MLPQDCHKELGHEEFRRSREGKNQDGMSLTGIYAATALPQMTKVCRGHVEL